jgi:uncharacterized membrane protein YqhA
VSLLDDPRTMPRWKRIPLGLAQLMVMEGNKLILAAILCIATVGFGYAGVLEMWHEVLHLIHSDSATTFIINLLSVIDQILLGGVALLIIQGSFQIYILSPSYNLLTGRRRYEAPALQGLTSGSLKEKAISTIKIASAVYLFKLILSFSTSQEMTWLSLAMLGGFHLLFILGFWVMARTNQNHHE